MALRLWSLGTLSLFTCKMVLMSPALPYLQGRRNENEIKESEGKNALKIALPKIIAQLLDGLKLKTRKLD